MRNRILDSLDEFARALDRAHVPTAAKTRLLESATPRTATVRTLETQPLVFELAA